MLNRTKLDLIGSGVIATLLSLAASTLPTSAASLFFFKGPTKAPSENVCLRFAHDAARRHNLQNININALNVSGSRDDFFVAMTCVGNIVVVMAAGNTGTNGSPIAKELFDAVRSEVCFDACN
jgi:hypothetical protein